MKWFFTTGLAVGLLLTASAGAETPLKIAASILPVHSLVSAVTGDIVAPTLVLPGSSSPHFHQLRPSQVRALHDADLVFWIGPEMETFLVRSMAALAAETRVISLMDSPGLHLLSNREETDWSGQASGADNVHEHDEADATRHTIDPHIWLSPENARHMVRTIVMILSELDPANRAAYQSNGEMTLARIAALEKNVANRLRGVREVPYVVFHDAYRYLEDYYQLSALGAITVNPDRPPSAKRVSTLQHIIRQHGAECVFVEPQFSTSWINALSADNQIRVGILDPVGAGIEPGPEAYFALIQSNTSALIDCLGQ